MTNPKSSINFNILSEKGNNTRQPKVVQEAKKALFESLEATDNMVNRNKCIEDLSKNRYENGINKVNKGIPAWKIKIGNNEMLVDETRYQDILEEYKKIIAETESEDKQKKLKRLDIQLAERMILDSGNMIEFNPLDKYTDSLTAKEEAQKAYKELKKIDAYKNKIEWAVKILGGEQHFIIKRTDEQLELIKTIATKTIKKETELPIEDEKKEIAKKQKKEVEEKKKELNKEANEKLNLNLLINRDNLADAIEKARQGKIFPMGLLSIRKGTTININNQKHLEEFKQKYTEAGNNMLRLKALDTEFAERIILNNPEWVDDNSKKYYIQINNDEIGKDIKSEEELEKESLRCRDSLRDQGYDVEYIKHTEKIETEENENDKAQFNDKYIASLQAEIVRITQPGKVATPLENITLIVYKRLVEWQYTIKEIKDRITVLEQPGKNRTPLEERTLSILKKALENIKQWENKENKKIYHIIRQKAGEEIIPIPIPIPIPEEIKDLELNAVISDMGTDVHRERVSLETEEELRDEYKKLGRYNMPQRAYLFLSRWAKRKRMIKAKMDAMEGKAFSTTDQVLNEKTGDASERHDLELEHSLDQVEKANTVTLQNVQVNDLCKRYLKTEITEDEFQTQFNTIIDNDANIQNVLQGQKITHIWTNILWKLNLQRAKWGLEEWVNKELNLYLADNNQSHIDTINMLITNHIKYNQTIPAFMKDYEAFLNKTPWAINKLQKYLQHQWAVMNMQVANVRMNMDILIKGKSAYQIDNKDRQKGRAYKLGNKLDKLPRWVQTAGFIGLSVGTWILTGWLGTIAAAAITTGVSASGVGAMNALKKRTHYTKEQNTHEKNVVTDYRQEQAKLKERQNSALNGKRYQRKTYKAKRQLALYDQTTQENIDISDTISDTISDLASKIGNLDAKEENYMKKNLIQGWVRLKYYREVGHNFLASNDKEKIEKDMKRLEKSIILWVEKLGKTLTDIETMQATDDTGANVNYVNIKKDLESSYNKSLAQFKRERRVLAVKYGIGTAMLSAGMSLGMQYLMWTGVFWDKTVTGVEGKSFSNSVTNNFDLGKAELLDTGTRNHIYNTGASVLHDSRVVDGSTITLNYGAGTDATQVIAWRLTPEVYAAKIQAVIDNVNGMSLDATTKGSILTHLHAHPREQSWATQDFTNDALHGMRCAELIEQAAKAAADSWKTHLIFQMNYDPNLDVVGTGLKNVAERVVNANFVVETPSIAWVEWSTRGRFLQVPVFFNTFKDRIEKDTNKKEKTPEKKEKQTKDKPTTPQKETEIEKKTLIPNKRKYYEDIKEEGPIGGKEIKDDEWINIDPKTGRGTPNEPIKRKNVGVSTRKEKINKVYKDIEDFSPEYPVTFKEKTLDEIALEVFTNPDIELYTDPKFINDSTKAQESREKGDKKWAIAMMKNIILQERAYIQEELEKQKENIDQIYSTLEKTFEKYKVKDLMKTLPSKDKIHLMCKYEFEAYNPNKKIEGWVSAAVCYSNHGHIMINYDFLHMRGKTPEMITAMFKDILIHELVHDSWVNNYHHYYTLKDKNKPASDAANRENEQFITRRVGLKMIKRIGKSDKFMAYGVAMNEAITQMLADEIGKDILPNGYKTWWYPKEKEIIHLLEDKFNIPFEMFAKAIINRTQDNESENNALRALNEKINGAHTANNQIWFERPEFLRLIMCVMDYESSQKSFGEDYVMTKALINGEQLVITNKMKQFFHPSLLWKDEKTGQYFRDKNGNTIMKQTLVASYPNLLDSNTQAVAA